MPEGYRPNEPVTIDQFTNWAQKTHREAFNRNRVVRAPGMLTWQTTQGVIHRPIPAESDIERADAEVDSFSFEAKITFHNGLTPMHISGSGQYNPPGTTDIIDAIELDLESHIFGATFGGQTERDIVRQDIEGNGAVLFWSPIIVLPQPVPYGWSLDLSFCVALSSGRDRGLISPFSRDRQQINDSGILAVQIDPLDPWAHVPMFQVGVANNPPEDRTRIANNSNPVNRVWEAYRESAWRFERYRPLSESDPESQYITIGVTGNNSLSSSSSLNPFTPVELLFPFGATVLIVGHAFKTSEKYLMLGTPEDEEDQWQYV